MANITNTLSANITATEDTTQNVIFNRTVPNLNFDSTLGVGVLYQVLGAGTTLITLPAVRCWQLYVRNNDGAKFVTVSTSSGGTGDATSHVLYPNDVYIIWHTPGQANSGFTTLGLTPSAATCPVEYFIGA